MSELDSEYLKWYIRYPRLKYDLRSSGVLDFQWSFNLEKFNLSETFSRGNPEAKELVAKRYGVLPENVFMSSEGASGVNTRIIKCLASRKDKKQAVVEYPVYEPLLRQTQSFFSDIKRIRRKKENNYEIDMSDLKKVVSDKTALLVITNPHAPTGVDSSRTELEEMMELACKHEFYVLCDEVYAEFDRSRNPTLFSIEPEWGITSTSFTKAYGLGGLKIGLALASEKLVKQFYQNVLNTIGCGSNLVEAAFTDLLASGKDTIERHKEKWAEIRRKTEKWLETVDGVSFVPNKCGVTFWLEIEKVKDTYRWTNDYTIPKMGLSTVPGAFFLYEDGYAIVKSNQTRLGVGNIKAGELDEALSIFEKAVNERINY
jgi:aspartate/methionine/tyrosine aminotransferase